MSHLLHSRSRGASSATHALRPSSHQHYCRSPALVPEPVPITSTSQVSFPAWCIQSKALHNSLLRCPWCAGSSRHHAAAVLQQSWCVVACNLLVLACSAASKYSSPMACGLLDVGENCIACMQPAPSSPSTKICSIASTSLAHTITSAGE